MTIFRLIYQDRDGAVYSEWFQVRVQMLHRARELERGGFSLVSLSDESVDRGARGLVRWLNSMGNQFLKTEVPEARRLGQTIH